MSASEWGTANATLPFPPASVSNWGIANAVLVNPENATAGYWGVRTSFGVLDLGPADGLGFSPLGTSALGS
jgi:hypothetical protein